VKLWYLPSADNGSSALNFQMIKIYAKSPNLLYFTATQNLMEFNGDIKEYKKLFLWHILEGYRPSKNIGV
jgi:hypothetical protein